MTNSRLTDPEVLESRFPVVLEDFHIRRGSGGKGRWQRRRRHAAAHPLSASRCSVAILSGHRAVPNPGAMGGEPGELGRNSVRRNDGRIEILPGCARDRGRGGRGDRDRHADRRRVGEAR